MKQTDDLIKDYEDHGFEVVEKTPGKIIFKAVYKDYKKKVKPDIHAKHPIFIDKDAKPSDEALVIVHNKCGHCNVYLNEDTCPKCNRTFKLRTRKPHIPYKNELHNPHVPA
jgi:uncharacterized protein with PIN domain